MLFSSLILLTLLPVVFGQQIIDGLIQALNASGLTSLASASAALNSTPQGQVVVQSISSGNWTIFAPSNQAFGSAPANLSSNASSVANILSYHIVSGNFTNESPEFPNITIGRTLLNDSSLVQLEGNKSQVLAWSKDNNGIFVINNGTIDRVQNTTSFQNFQILVIDAILQPPPKTSDVLANNIYNLNNLTAVLGVVNITGALDEAHGITLFAPNDTAFSTTQCNVSGLLSNVTAAIALLGNHIINGTTVYSPEFDAGNNFTSTSGEQFTFTSNSSGQFVSIGGSNTARIVRSDVLTSNGVVHVIDSVLCDTQSNPPAASSAVQSASSAAATMTTTETGPVGVAPTSTA
ncbi:hypothetical protein AZE42_04194 [Rhizopogon vesiculosus]|uniref:FAS1 domain-containing protein n=1 Tax=Rhizopogon vesiculosus TaxID=180088 RepID=A0A1J8Q4C0_9AGAM|nr:hypothetical protein AZE42_04194 [Rhizopogon vesiculosus]